MSERLPVEQCLALDLSGQWIDLVHGAVILHRMWIDGTEFNWSTKKAAA
jgi:hypothetical protein